MIWRAFFFCLVFLGLSGPAQAVEPPHNTEARLFSAVNGTGALTTLPAGIDIRMKDGWKIYWRTPGEAGLAPVLNWAGSTNLKSATVRWPAPHRFVAFDIDNFGYQDHVTLPLDIVPEDTGDAVELKLRLDLLVCKDLCVPESHTLSLTIPKGAADVSADQPVYETALKTVPAADKTESFSITSAAVVTGSDGKPTFRVEAHAAAAPGADADVFIENTAAISAGKPTFHYAADTGTLTIDAPVRSEGTAESIVQSLGDSPLTLTYVDGDTAFERQASLGGAAAAVQNVLNAAGTLDASILFLAFLGGLILNLMPCMLPVLSIKILSVLRHGGKDHRIHRWEIFGSFMAAAAGIIFSFWVLAGSLIFLKNAGHSIGWGIQFQHPGFLIFMITVLLGFAANMWGLFEIPLPRFIAHSLSRQHEHEPTRLGHFLTGAFATLLATPCTAPFLGTVIGFALAREAFDILVVFTFLGLGLAFPYIVFALSPQLFKYMPKPGAWMLTLKKVLAVFVAVTAGWLLHVLVTVTTQPTLDEGWTAFSEELIAPAVAEGRTVIVDVTADWCLTCKANKRLVLDQKEIEDALYSPNVLRLQADWTSRDETISAYLKKYGRYGIPFNIVYGPEAPDGIILGELLTQKDVMQALEKAAGE